MAPLKLSELLTTFAFQRQFSHANVIWPTKKEGLRTLSVYSKVNEYGQHYIESTFFLKIVDSEGKVGFKIHWDVLQMGKLVV